MKLCTFVASPCYFLGLLNYYPILKKIKGENWDSELFGVIEKVIFSLKNGLILVHSELHYNKSIL